MADLEALKTAIEAGDRATATAITGQAVDEGMDPRTVLDAMTAAMEVIGGRFQRNEIYVPEMLISRPRHEGGHGDPRARSSRRRASGPSTRPSSGRSRATSTTSARTSSGMMWKGANIEVVDLGTNVTAERLRRGGPGARGRRSSASAPS